MTCTINFDIIKIGAKMSHLALYRQFRPKNFDEVIGQNHIVETLRHQIENNTISHAYLFCGTRGTGKTSCAKIFAKAVNCLHPKNGSPCGKCEVCKAIESNANFDIMEIDAASNNRVDEIRDLREKVNYLPSVGKYKVYIIDEVHMLTDSAFNALLKTLEEPPAHIIFILATTEPEKLPATILSRCMRFDFKLVTVDALAKQLEIVFNQTDTKFEPRALELIAKAGNGSVRDTLSVAEMCKSFSNNNITYQSVEECLGLTDDRTLFAIASSVVNRDGGKILNEISKLYSLGKNMSTLLADLYEFFKNVLTLKLAPNFDLKVPQNIKDNYLAIAEQCTERQLLDIVKLLSDNLSQIKHSINDKVFTEVSILGLIYNENQELESLKTRLQDLENKLNDTNYQYKAPSQVNPEKKVEQQINASNVQSQQNVEKKQTQISIAFSPKSIFGGLVGYVRDCGEMMLFSAMSDVSNVDIENNKLAIYCKEKDVADLLSSHKNILKKYVQEKYNLLDVDICLEEQKKDDISVLNDMLNGKLKIE